MAYQAICNQVLAFITVQAEHFEGKQQNPTEINVQISDIKKAPGAL